VAAFWLVFEFKDALDLRYVSQAVLPARRVPTFIVGKTGDDLTIFSGLADYSTIRGTILSLRQ
jgi:hypothetical protein